MHNENYVFIKDNDGNQLRFRRTDTFCPRLKSRVTFKDTESDEVAQDSKEQKHIS